MKNKGYLKYVVIALALVFLVTTALLLIELWDSRNGKSSGGNAQEGVLSYQGKDYVRKENLETFLVLGLDKYKDANASDSHGTGVQADFLMLFVFDNDTKQCSAIQINRDSMTTVNRLGIGGVKTDSFTRQIALAYNYVADINDKIRCRNTKDSVEALLPGVKVDHYLAMTMDAVIAMNDMVGGVEVQVLDDFTGIDEALVKGQKVTLQGTQALTYVRTRYGMDDSTNNTRMARQKQYMEALYSKLLTCMAGDDEFVLRFVDTVDDYMTFDLSNQGLKTFAEKFDQYEFLGIQSLQGETKMGEEFLEFYPNEDAVKQLVVTLFYKPKTN